MYRPPGVVDRIESNVGVKSSQLDEKIWNTMPTTKLYRRGKPDEKKDEKRDERDKYGDNKKEREKDNHIFKKVEELLTINLKTDNPNSINFEKLF